MYLVDTGLAVSDNPECQTFRLLGVLSSDFSRGLWTWPSWVIGAPAFDHKIGNAAHSGVSEVLLFTKSYKWKKQRWTKWTLGRLLLETMRFWRSPTVRQFKMADRRMWAEQKSKLLDKAWQWSNHSLLFPCSISFAENFLTCLRNKAYVYYYLLLPLRQGFPKPCHLWENQQLRGFRVYLALYLSRLGKCIFSLL